MDTTPSATRDSQPRASGWRRWLRFSLRTFLIVCTLLALAFGWLGGVLIRVRHQRAIVAQVERAGGEVSYDYELAGEQVDGHWQPKSPPGPKLVRLLIGDDAYAHVESIDFGYKVDRVVDADLAVLAELPRLQRLGLYGSRISDNGLANLVRPGTAIETIDISCRNVTDGGMAHLARLPKLEHLSIGEARLSAAGLLQLVDATNLRGLGLTGTSATDDVLRHIDRLDQLHSLTLARTSISSSGLEPVGRLANLRELSISEAPGVDDTAMVHIGRLRELKGLDLMFSGITDDGLVHLRGLEKLELLSLWSTKASDAGMQHVATLSQLKCLQLTRTDVGDEGVAALTSLTDLEELCLGYTAITDEATVHLAEMTQLRLLFVDGTAITDDGLRRLKTLGHLEWLRIGPNVTEPAASELKAYLPNCRISGWGPAGVGTFVIPAE